MSIGVGVEGGVAIDVDVAVGVLATVAVSVEAGVTLGWSKYVGDKGISIGIDHFGASAPYQVLYEQFGISAEKVAAAAESLLS